ncbi:hypothetical protein [Shewanella sp.]|uniref:hypothetical protein n=1 Tax=Shewanella sp. TaxID=50422 RepID=UPI003A96F561
MRNLLLLACLLTPLAHAAPKNAIVMASGASVKDCEHYNALRASENIAETTVNMMMASEYLQCSLTPTLTPVDEPAAVLQQIADQLRIRAIPTSVGRRAGENMVFSAMFNISEQGTLRFSEEQHIIDIRLKGQLDDHSYLLWVSDEILDRTYRAYFPVVVEHQGENFSARPFYASGY